MHFHAHERLLMYYMYFVKNLRDNLVVSRYIYGAQVYVTYKHHKNNTTFSPSQ
jgi:hypothetical protein